MSNTIQIAINENNLIKNIGNIFSESETVIFELLQNAYRAGASQARMIYDDETKTFAIRDDGQGIKNFQTLFTIAQSNWSKKIEKQQPYGMGFLSALFAAERLIVRSRGKELNAACADIISGKEIEITTCHRSELTSIELIGINDGLAQFLKRELNNANDVRFAGQPIKVYLNGIQKNRQYSRVELDASQNHFMTKFKHGVIYSRKDCSSGISQMFLQGMVMQGFNSHLNADHIVHLDDSTPARMPDRFTLLNRKEVIESVEDAIGEIMKMQVLDQKTQMTDFEFTSNSKLFMLAQKYCPEILKSVPWLPSRMFVRASGLDLNLDAINRYHQSGNDSPAYHQDFLAKATIVTNLDERDESTTLIGSYLKQFDDVLVLVNEPLEVDHWFDRNNVISSDTLTVNATYHNPREKVSLEGFILASIVCCDSIELDGPFGKVDATDGFVYENGTLYVTSKSPLCEALQAICSYRDEMDYYLDDALGVDLNNLKQIVEDVLRDSAIDVITSGLNKLNDVALKKLNGKSFLLSVSDNGNIHITETPNQLTE